VETVGIGECAGAGIDHLALAEAEITYQRNSRNAFALTGELDEADRCLASILDAVSDALAKEMMVPQPLQAHELNRLRATVDGGSNANDEHVALAANDDEHVALAANVESWANETLASARQRSGAGGLPTALAS